MRFVSRWSYACANHFAKAMNESHKKRAVYYYGFFVVIGGLVKGTIILVTAALFGVLVPTALMALVFGSLRMLAGGYHMDTYGRCLLISLGIFVLPAAIARHTFVYWSGTHIIVMISLTFVFGLYALIRYAPKDSPNKPITEPKEIRKFKTLSLIYLFGWLITVSALALMELNLYSIVLCFGAILELFSITPTGHRFFDAVKERLAIIVD